MRWEKTKIIQIIFYWIGKNYKLIAKGLRIQIGLEGPDVTQTINFIGMLDRDEGAPMFFIIERSEETTLNFSQNAVSII